MESLEAWENEAKKELSVDEMDSLVKEYKSLRDDYEEKKKVSTEAYHKYKQKEGQILEALENSNKSKYFVDGIGTVSKEEKLRVSTPKDAESKKKLFKYFRDMGPDFYLSMVTVNSNTLNSFYNQESEKHADDPTWNIPGLGEPQVQKTMKFRRSK